MPTIAGRLPPRPILVAAGLLVLYLVWGSTYLGIRIAVQTIPPFLMAGLRFLLAGVVLLGWSLLRDGRAFAWPTRREWRDTFIVGALLLGAGMGLVAWGEQTVPSGIAALMIAVMPVWVAVLGRLFFTERLPRAAVVGVAIGLVGVAILVSPSGNPSERLDLAGIAALALSPICWSGGSLFSAHRARLPARPLVATGGQMLAGSAVLLVASIVTGEAGRLHVEAISSASLGAFAYLTVVGSLVAFTTYVLMLRAAPLPLIATYAYVNPIVAVFLGWVVLSEPLTPRTILAGGVIVFAVALIITARGRMRQPTSELGTPADAGAVAAAPTAARRAAIDPAGASEG
jgi:drug/metabolite transporter (DMT)-like permease